MGYLAGSLIFIKSHDLVHGLNPWTARSVNSVASTLTSVSVPSSFLFWSSRRLHESDCEFDVYAKHPPRGSARRLKAVLVLVELRATAETRGP